MQKPYCEIVFCPISNRKEEVFFYEECIDSRYYLKFNGCDFNWHKGDLPCEECRETAYNQLINRKLY